MAVLGLSLLACRMDNPAFNDGDELAEGETAGTSEAGTEAGSSEAGTSEAGETTTTDADGSSTDADGSTNADGSTDGTSCGGCEPCHVCDENLAECVPTPDAPCEEAGIDCSDYLFGPVEGTCYSLAANMLAGKCSPEGTCEPRSHTECPNVKGEPQCDYECIGDQFQCEAFAATSDLLSHCVDNGPGPFCDSDFCFDSIIGYKQCLGGFCEDFEFDDCFPYACSIDTLSCIESCDGPPDCALGSMCDLMVGMCCEGLCG